MLTNPTVVVIALGMICLLQNSPAEAATKHVPQLMKVFRGIQFDTSKKHFYLHRARYGLQVQLRDPLVRKAMELPDGAKLSEECLKKMATAVDDIEDTFYAGFSYNCRNHSQYSMECLEQAEPQYLDELVKLGEETRKCWISQPGA